VVRNDKWLLLPQYHVFGSEELSACTRGIAELAPEPYIAVSGQDAERLRVVSGSFVSIKVFERAYELPVKIDRTLQRGIILVPAGLPGMPVMPWSGWVQVVVSS